MNNLCCLEEEAKGEEMDEGMGGITSASTRRVVNSTHPNQLGTHSLAHAAMKYP